MRRARRGFPLKVEFQLKIKRRFFSYNIGDYIAGQVDLNFRKVEVGCLKIDNAFDGAVLIGMGHGVERDGHGACFIGG